MKKIYMMLLGACWVACGTHDNAPVDPFVFSAATALDGGIAKVTHLMFAHPAALRAMLGLTCGSDAICEGTAPAEGDRCSAEAAIWSEDFALSFDGCLASGEPVVSCFERAHAEHEPSEEQLQHVAQCREGLSRCGMVDSDGCDALEVLVDANLVQGSLDCAAGSCDSASACLAVAMYAEAPQPRDGCKLRLPLE